MNCDTGHLVTQALLEEMGALERAAYTEVPIGLDHAAVQKLNGDQEAYVSLRSGGKLSRFAGETRKQRRLMAKLSRKQNRAK